MFQILSNIASSYLFNLILYICNQQIRGINFNLIIISQIYNRMINDYTTLTKSRFIPGQY